MTETLATILISILGGVNLLELIGFIVFYKQNKKSRELDNDNKAANNFDKVVEVNKEVIDMLKQNYKELDDECDKQAKDDGRKTSTNGIDSYFKNGKENGRISKM